MAELRKDPITGTWVIIAAERKQRPRLYRLVAEESELARPPSCPFCPGNEGMTPPEITALRAAGSTANAPGWTLRVFPNKFPALRVEGELQRSAEGFYDKMSGIGAHEVIVETPDHDRSLADLGLERIADLLRVFRARIADLRQDVRFRYVMVFKNRGPAAGATIPHSHSQLIALPVVPIRVQEELEGARQHFRLKERCIFCDIIQAERQAGARLLDESDGFLVLAPFAPRFPFELAIYPKPHRPRYETSGDGDLLDLAALLKKTLARVNRALNRPDYNLILHNAPFYKDVDDFFHWHIEFMPVLGRVAGFEWGSGFYINPVSPEESVQALKAT